MTVVTFRTNVAVLIWLAWYCALHLVIPLRIFWALVTIWLSTNGNRGQSCAWRSSCKY